MAAHKGREKRATGEPTTPLYTQVAPTTKDALNAGAAALNISLGAYIDLFVKHAAASTGQDSSTERASSPHSSLPVWVREHLEKEQLPLKFSA